MKYADYINTMNDILAKQAEINDHNRSYVRVLRPHNPKKVNIIGSFEEAIKLETIPQENFTALSRKSFGMVAEETFQKYTSMLFGADSIFGNVDMFQKYIENNYVNFCVDSEEFKAYFDNAKTLSWWGENVKFENKSVDAVQKAFQKALFARCILQTIRVGCFKFATSKVTNLVEVIEGILNGDMSCEYKKDGEYITISGRLSQETLKNLDEFVSFDKNGENLEFTIKNQENSHSMTELYNKTYEEYYRFLGSAIYSGVIPRLCKVEYSAPKMSNMDMQELRLILGRTSYLTMYALNKPKILKHPFLQRCKDSDVDMTLRELNEYFDASEIKAQMEFRNAISKGSDEFESLNMYLRHSWNVHNMNVSGNLITSDNYCIYTKRGNEVVDAGNYYCSVNGGSEIFDSTVEFYHSSVLEDLPTIHYGNGPIYFGGELTREAIGELGIIDASTFWNYYGISVLGKSNKIITNGAKQVIWFHFNVLGERQCMDTFEQIVENKKLAAENFESAKIYGYKLLTYQSKFELLLNVFFRFLDMILNNTDLIAMGGLVLALLLGQEQLSIGSQITMFLGIVAVVSVGYKIYCELKEKQQKKNIVSYQNKKRIKIEKRLNDRRLGEPRRKDPIFMALLALRFERIFHE